MRDLQFQDSGCEPTRGPRVAVVAARRGLRKLLRPMFVRLVEILDSVVSRLDRAEARIDVNLEQIYASGARLNAVETRLDSAERLGEILDERTHGLAAHLAGLNAEHLALHADVERLSSRIATAESEIDTGKVRLGRNDVLIDLCLKKIDAGGARLDAAETRLISTERLGEILDKRTHGLAAHLAGLNAEHSALHADCQPLQNLIPRVDAAESRLDSFDWHVAVLHPRTEGLSAHLAGLSDDHRALHAKVQTRVVQLGALSEAVSNLGRRQDELDEKLQAVQALHWDHVALARRLAVIEDLLLARPSSDEPDARPSLPFPGFDDVDEARSRVG